MGCHTWVYKKVSALTDDEKIKIAEKNEDFYINHWWAEKLTVDELEVQVKEWYKEQPEVYENHGTPREYAEQIIKEHADSRKQYNEDPWKYFLGKHKNDYPVCFEYKKETYVNIDFDYPFRVFGYSSREFRERNKLIDWLKRKHGGVEYYSIQEGKTVEGFTEELEKRICEYFKTHGEDNLLFDFG